MEGYRQELENLVQTWQPCKQLYGICVHKLYRYI